VEFDETKLRPFLIRNYSPANQAMQEAFQELLEKKFNDVEPESLENRLNEIVVTARKMTARDSHRRVNFTSDLLSQNDEYFNGVPETRPSA
jgi:hypothetical protein